MTAKTLLCLALASMNGFAVSAATGTAAAAAPLSASASVPDGTANVPYSAPVAIGGFPPYGYIVAGSLPPGLALDIVSGALSGTPATAGSYSFTVAVSDSSGTGLPTQAYQMNIAPPLTITTASLPIGTVGQVYSAPLAASGGRPPYTWSASGLPPALNLDPLTGAITGTPVAAGTSSVAITVSDTSGGSPVSQSYNLTILVPLAITTSSLPNGTALSAYSATLAASGGVSPYTWSATGLPSGLNLNAGTGAITGTPTAAGTSTVNFTVTDTSRTSSSTSLNISIAAPLAITTGSLPNGIVNSAYSATLDATGGAPPYTWSASSLPPGVNLNAVSGQIGGTPTTAGSYSPNVQVKDANGATVSKSYSVTIAAQLAITTGSLPNGIVNSAYSATLDATGGTPPYTWSASSLPPGVNLNAGSGQISGTPTTAGSYSPNVQVKDANGATVSRSYSVRIAAQLAITTGSLPNGKTGSAYSASLAASGGTPPYTWSITAGSLPAGLALNSGNGQITGTPTAAGTANITLQVSDAGGLTSSNSFSISIGTPPPPLTLGGTFADGTTGVAYSQALTAGGGTPPYTWSITSGSLPPGLTLNNTNGKVSGTPAQRGSFNFTVQVTDSAGVTQSQPVTVSINGLTITTGSLPDATIGTAYSQQLTASGGATPYVWSLFLSSLPPGLSLDGRTGIVSGAPAATGMFVFSVQVQDANGVIVTRQFSIAVASGLTITSTSPLPAAAVGTSYSQALAAISGIAPYTWTVSSGTPPAGIALDSSTGLLSGKAQAVGTYSFTVKVTDGSGAQASKAFTLTVVGALTVSTNSLPGGSLGAAYSQVLAAVAGTSPYTWSVTAGALPPGLTLNTSTGAISGTPTAQGRYSFTVQVQDAVGATATQALSITIGSALAVTSGPALASGALAMAYSQTLAAAGGTPPYTWAITSGALPAGLSLNAASGAISGTPQAAGDYTFTAQVTDGTRATASASLSLRITAQGVPAVTITDVPDTAGPLEQPAVGLALASPYPVALTGQLVLSFEADAAVPVDDPAIQFSTGGRTVSFTIPANATRATFPSPALQLQTGSVAGTITITAKLEAGGADITPNPAPAHTVKISRSAPVIRAVKLVKTATGFEVWITGYAPSREITQAALHFTAAPGSNLQTTDVTVPMSDAAKQWYQDPGSKAYGSQFTIVQPFTLVGNGNAVSSVSVTLANTLGASPAASASF